MQLFGQGMVAFKRKNIGLGCKKALLVKRLSGGAACGIELCQCGGILAGMRRLQLNIELRHGAGAPAEAGACCAGWFCASLSVLATHA